MSRTLTTGARVVVSADTVTIRRAEYERLLAKAGEVVPDGGDDDTDGPALPTPDAAGNFPAVEYVRASIARALIRRRRAAGLSQGELATLAGVRRETVSRIESGKHTVGERVMARIERALLKRQAAPKPKPKPRPPGKRRRQRSNH